MAKIYAICGKICSGKSTYCETLRAEKRAMLLSIDELMLAMFDPELGENHDKVSGRAKEYLLARAKELLEIGVDVVLDWGFWTREGRDEFRSYCTRSGIEMEMRYLHMSGPEWERRIAKRNAQVQAGRSDAYLVDEGLMEKFSRMFQEPDRDEVDAWVEI